ncbi:type I-A CRISPR-associated protein CsaX [Metallosphaera tengchongensis]|uniref:type I-A CRISPR-associated protein CsaX n=1 Tax=Metallosphaera tengchongensis TaxID=1532350 RepID=UPI001FE9B918|nr:type I-A CRISPR-associated protein CsaX [Metallosphaera tengchongensis]
MTVPLYDIFGDNFVITLASLTSNARRTLDSVEFDERELRDALLTASEVAKAREGAGKFDFPRSGNDKRSFSASLKCFNIPEGTPVSTALEKVANSLSPQPSCEEVSSLSMLKPEFYEYARTPGFYGGRKTGIEVSPTYVMLSVAGWVLSRLGRAPVANREYVGVYAFPIDIDRKFSTIPSLLKSLGNGMIPGTEPATALSIWLASKMLESKAIVDQVMLYFMSEPGGQSPARVTSGQIVSVERLVKHKKFSDVHKTAEIIARRALSPDPWECDKGGFSVRFSNLLFEVLTGSRREVELTYFANREYMSWRNSDDDKKKECLDYYKSASSIANKVAEV